VRVTMCFGPAHPFRNAASLFDESLFALIRKGHEVHSCVVFKAQLFVNLPSQRQELGIKISKRLLALKGQASIAPPLIVPREHSNNVASVHASTGHTLTPYLSPISPTTSSLVPGHAAAAKYQKLYAALSSLQSE
jgi:hypothetical protein